MWLLLGCPTEPPGFDTELAAALTDVVDQANTAPGAAVAVIVGGETWVHPTGWSTPDRDIDADDTFRLGSITKTFVAATVLRRVEEGGLSLDDRLANFVPDAPYADRISIRDLLAHTSGLPDYAIDGDILTTLSEVHTAWQLVEAIADQPLLFDPGADHAYANTNYVLLGLVLDTIGPGTWEDQVGSLISNLPDTTVLDEPTVVGPSAGSTPPGPSIRRSRGRPDRSDRGRHGGLG